ncbi:type IV pilus twitching motility protein PilT, partial [Legionella tunisiensis]|uniref:type IV pilus twitching motility protein PilT n=1 Tax=Legionella tunisiensis TaxID=1034944 RepID=UPI00036C4668
LREDPDVILIGELRDLETIRLAMTAAETGHLVFATLHTNSAVKAIHRIIDVFPGAEKSMARSMLAESLQAVIAQNLLPKINGGRIAAFEIMLCNTAIRNLIREDKLAQMYSSMQTGQAKGMQTLEQHLMQLWRANLIAEHHVREGAAYRC